MLHNLLKTTGVFVFSLLLTTDILSQNVGVDVASPQQKLDVLGGIRIGNTTVGLAGSIRWTGTQFEGHDGSVWAPFGSGSGTSWSLTGNSGTVSGTNFLGTTDNVDFRIRTNNLDRLTVNTAGNVGIGTTAPADKLDVFGTIKATNPGTSPSGSSIKLSSPANDIGVTMDRGNGSGTSQQRWDIKITSDNALRFRSQNTTDYFAFTNTGNFGIGTTIPVNKLDIEGGLAVGATYSGTNTATANGAIIEGNVGIGTSAPTEKLDVLNGNLTVRTNANGTTAKIIISGARNGGNIGWNNTAGSGHSILEFINYDGGNSSTFYTSGRIESANQPGSDDGDLRFYTSSDMVLQEVMRMDYTGNVGIGQEPTQKLDVNGQIRMRTGATTGYIPVSDVNGTMTWTNPSTIVGTQAWKLTGNSGTVPGTNFIGTTDNVDFRIRTNNTDKVTIASSGNVGIGNTNPLQKLHVAGKIWANDGSSNVFVGENSGAASTTSYLNTAVGFDALSSITTSGDNTAIGYRNMRFLTTGGANSSIGSYAMHAVTTGGSNVALGYGALNSLEDGNNNVAIGRAAGSGNINGSGNIFIGFRAGDGSTGSNELYIDNSNTASPLIFGNFTSNIINVNGSLGINTATPGQRLDVNGDARIQNGTVHIWALNATEGGQINLADGNNDADGQPNAWSLDVSNNDFRIMDDGAVRAFFQDDGNLGIGTTVPAQKLDVNGKIQMRTGATTGYIPVSDANGTMTWTNPSTIITAYVDEIRDADNDTKVQVEESADEDKIRFDTFGSERMIIDNTGNVGIGLSSPTERLHISNANLLLSGSGTTVNGIQLYPKSGTGNSGGRIYFREDNNDLFGFSMGYNGGNTGNEILNWPANSFNISRHGNDATGTVILHINGSTNVGIGTTSPVAKLDVSGAFNASGGGTFGNNVQITGNYYFDNTSGTGSSNPPFRVDGFNDIFYMVAESNGTGPAGGTEIRLRTAAGAAAAVDRMTIDNNGNVGVGVTAPSTKLHVQTTGTGLNLPIFAQNTTANDAGGTAVGIGFSNETSASVPPKAAIVHERNANYARGSMHFVLANYTNNNAMTLADTKMTLTKEGNLGIGTTAPAQVLDVNGKIQMRTGATTGYIPVSDANGTMTWTAPSSLGADVTTASNGLTEVGNDIQLGGGLTTNTTVTQDNAEVLTFANNGTGNTVINLQSTGDFDVQDNGTSVLFVKDDGNVGIGTSAPSTPLYVAALTANGPTVTIATGSNQYPSTLTLLPSSHATSERATIELDNWGILQDINGNGTQDFAIYNNLNNSHAIAIKTDNNVGIGTTSPGAKLDVNGKIQMRTGAATGYIPVSDANGTMTWTDPATVVGAQAWKLTGNSGTVSGTNFIGTTDNVPVDIKSNSSSSTSYVRITNKGQIYEMGTGRSVFLGESAGNNDDLTNNDNAFIGYEAGLSNTTGQANAAVGYRALRLNTTGVNNTAMGYDAMGANTTGHSNLGLGFWALTANTTGFANAAVGLNAIKANTTGNGNTALGALAGYDNVTPANSNTTGSNNTFIGYNSGYLNSTQRNNATAIGYNAKVDASNAMVLGGTGADAVNVGIGTTSPTKKLSVWNGDMIIGGNQNFVDRGMTIYGARQGTTNTTWNFANQGHAFIKFDNYDGDNSAIQYTSGIISSFNVPGSDDGDLRFFTTSDMVPAEAMRIDYLGNVGIGAAPAEKLHIAGKIRMVDGNQTAGYVPVSDANGTMTWTNPTSLTITETDPQVSSATTNYIPKWNGTTLVDGVAFDNGTNIGIGTTNPTNKLDVVGGSISSSDNYYIGNTSGTGTTPFRIDGFSNILYVLAENGTDGSATGTEIRLRTSNTNSSASDRMTINNNGNVGIGTTAPVELLHAGKNGSDNYIRVDAGNPSANSSGLKLYESGFNFGWNVRFDASDDDLYFEHNNGGSISSMMKIDNSGNIGIGTTTPAQKLDVNGKIQMRTGATAGYIPVSDANGTMTWTNLATSTTAYVDEIRDADNDTKVQVEESADEDKIRFDMAGTEYLVMTAGRLNVVNTGGSTFLGQDAGLADDLTNNFNTFTGYFSGKATTTGSDNAAYGAGSLENNVSGSSNTALGRLAMLNRTSGSFNTAVGAQALYGNISGSNNTALGMAAGNNSTGSGNVFIGYAAGYSETGNDKLYIDNSPTTSPLIYGDFASNVLSFNGNVGIGTTSPGAYLDITGTNAGTNSLQLRSGNTGSGTSSKQIIFGYSGTENYRHAIQTRHSSGGDANNAIDFYVWDEGTDAAGTIGTKRVMTIDGNGTTGSVGIGTPTPAEELHVVGNIRMVDGNQAANKVMVSDANGTGTWTDATSLTVTETDPQVSSTTTNYIPKWNGTALVDGVAFDNGTNIGIGSTSPAEKLDVAGRIMATNPGTSPSGSNIILGSPANDIGITMNRGDGSGSSQQRWDMKITSDNAIRFRSANTTDLFAFTNTGNLGIGTTSPGSKLYVAYTSGSGPAATIESGSDQYPTAVRILPSTHASSRRSSLRLDDWYLLQDVTGTGTKDFAIYQAGSANTQRLYIKTDGNIGIGTASPSALLHVSGNSTSSQLLVNPVATTGQDASVSIRGARNGSTTAFQSQLKFENYDNDLTATNVLGTISGKVTNATTNIGDLVFNNSTDGTTLTETMRLTSGGNVGIATTTPSTILSFGGDANRTIGMERTTGTDGFDLTIQAGGAKAGTSDNDGGNLTLSAGIATGNGSIVPKSNIIFKTATQLGSSSSIDVIPDEKMRITANGNVGIGISSPIYDLDIYKTDNSVDQRIYNNSSSGTSHLLVGANGGGHINLIANSSGATLLGIPAGVSGLVTDYTDMIFATGASGSGTENMRITTGGYVGIGTTNPTQAKLVVNGSQNNTLSYGYLNSSGNTNTTSGTNSYSIYASARIAATEFNAYSDQRIKNINGISNSSNDLKTIMGIEITDYTFIDKVEKGDVVQKKVIAQQVEKIYPQAVSIITDVVPDIYKIAEINAGRITVANNLKAGEKVKLIFENRTELVEVNDADENGFSVNLPDNGKVFVFGREVNDFRTVDYEALSTLNISATQELVKMINQLKTENTEMKNRFSALSSDVEMLKTMLNAGTKAEK